MSKPVSSMTGFATADRQTPLGLLSVEIRCVNSRFLDLTMRLPDELRAVEPQCRAEIAARIARGKCECRMRLTATEPLAGQTLRSEAIAALEALQREVLAVQPAARPLSVSEILLFPGVLAPAAADRDAVAREVLEALRAALEAFAATRRQEGKALAAVLRKDCDEIAGIAAQVRARMPELLQAAKDRLQARLEEAIGAPLAQTGAITREEAAERIRQETALIGMRMDVAEELDRLDTHVAEVRRVLAVGGPVGRRLDFLMQELNRESNTLGSKAASIEMTDASVNLKILIEQMREQIQNLE